MTYSVFGQTYKKIIKGFKVNAFAFEELCFSPSGPPLRWYLSLTSLHLSFHLLLFLLSQDPQSLLRARKLQLKLSQSGTQLRLSGDLKGEAGTRLVVKKKEKKKQNAKNPQVVYAQPTRAAGRVSSR